MNIEHSKQPIVLVVSRNHTTGLGIVRSLGAAGYTVDLMASSHVSGKTAAFSGSKYIRKCIEVVSDKVHGEDAVLLEALLKYGADRNGETVLFPSDDYTAFLTDAHRTQLEQYFRIPGVVGGENGALISCADRVRQHELAKDSGLLIPSYWVLSRDEAVHIPEDLKYPCVCMPVLYEKDTGSDCAICRDIFELLTHIEKLRIHNAHCDILLREYLEISGKITISGVCLDQELLIPAVIKTAENSHRQSSTTMTGVLAPAQELGNTWEKICDMLKKLHYTGLFGMELLVVGDKIYFSEIVLRSSSAVYAYTACGVNQPAIVVDAILGKEYDAGEISGFGKRFVNEKALWDDYFYRYLTKKEVRQILDEAEISVLTDENDPIPGTVTRKDIAAGSRERWKRTVKTWIKTHIFPVLSRVKQTLLGYPQVKKENREASAENTPRVVVSGRNYCSNLCITRALGQAGYDVEVLRIFRVRPRRLNLLANLRPDAYSKYVKAYHVCVSRRRNSRIVNKLIMMADPQNKKLLIPADDVVADLVDEYYDVLKNYYHLPNIQDTPRQINHMMNKEVQKNLAEAAGLPVINSCVIRTQEGRFEIPDSVQYPCFIKPNVSTNGLKSKMQKCDTEEELRQTLSELCQKADIEMLVQDFVQIGREYSILGLSTKDGVVGPGFFGAENGGHSERRGVALTGQVVPCAQRQQLIDDILRFVEALNFEGLFDVDLIETVDGKMYFVELNMRFGGSGYAVTESGANLPGMYADYVLKHKPIDRNCMVTQPGKRFISEKVMLEEYTKGFLTWAECKKHMKEVDIHFLKNNEDMRPYRHFRRFYPIASVMRLYYKLKQS